MSCSNKGTIIVKQPKPYRFLVTAKTATGGGGGATNAKKLIYDSATAKTEQVENAEQALDKLYGESVRYTEQTKTESERTQARANIGAASGADVAQHTEQITNLQTKKAEKSELPTKVSELENDKGYLTDVSEKQDKLVSGQNIKTINGMSILGNGNLDLQGGGGEPIDLTNYVTRIKGQIPMLGIRYTSLGKWTQCSKLFHGVVYDEDTHDIYCEVAGNASTGGICRIHNDEIISYYNMDTYDAAERPLVKIGNYLYAIQMGWIDREKIIKLEATTCKKILEYKHTGLLLMNSKEGLFTIDNNLYLWAADKKLYQVNKEDLTLSAPLYENLQFVLQYNTNRIVLADTNDVFELTIEGEQFRRPLPQEYKHIDQIEISHSSQYSNIKSEAFLLLRNRNKITTFYHEGGSYGGGEVLLDEISGSYYRIYDVKGLYRASVNHDINSFRVETGIHYYCLGSSARLQNINKYADGIRLQHGPYNYGATPIFPVIGGFFM